MISLQNVYMYDIVWCVCKASLYMMSEYVFAKWFLYDVMECWNRKVFHNSLQHNIMTSRQSVSDLFTGLRVISCLYSDFSCILAWAENTKLHYSELTSLPCFLHHRRLTSLPYWLHYSQSRLCHIVYVIASSRLWHTGYFIAVQI